MKKIKEYRANIHNGYVRLADVVPLATPFTILIDPTNACNFKCIFCPTGDQELLNHVGRPKGLMSLELFKKIIDDIDKFDQKVKKLQLYKDGEPLLNKALPDMIACAKAKNVAEVVETTTNGALLDQEKSKDLIDAGLDCIRFSIEHVSENGYQKITQNFANYDLIRQNISYLYELKESLNSDLIIHIKLLDVDLTAIEQQKFYDDFNAICDTINIDTLMDWGGSDSLGRDFMLGEEPDKFINSVGAIQTDRQVCSAPFKSLAVNFNGQVSVCCVDWKLETLVGDVNKVSLMDIWNGEALKEFRMAHLNGNRKSLSACADCKYYLGFSDFENLDEFASEIIGRL